MEEYGYVVAYSVLEQPALLQVYDPTMYYMLLDQSVRLAALGRWGWEWDQVGFVA